MVQYGQLVVAVIAAGVGISIQTDTISVWILLAAALAQGTVWSFMMPARQSLIPELVPKPQLTNAIALSASGMSLMTLTGPGLGGLSYAILGPGPTYFVIAVLNLAAFAPDARCAKRPECITRRSQTIRSAGCRRRRIALRTAKSNDSVPVAPASCNYHVVDVVPAH